MLVLCYLKVLLLVLEAESKISFFPQRANGGAIFHRPSSLAAEDIFNGHAKPKAKPEITLISMANISEAGTDSELDTTSDNQPGTLSSSGHTGPPPSSPVPVFVTKSPVGSKYFVTWRPGPDPETKDPSNIIITVRNSPDQLTSSHKDTYKPQHFFSQFSHSSPASTLAPFLLETSISLSKPSSSPAPPTQPWSYTPVFNPIFDFKTTTKPSSQYAATHKFKKKTSTKRRFRPKRRKTTKSTTSTTTETTAAMITKTTQMPTKEPFLSHESQISPFLSKFSLNKTDPDKSQQLSPTFSIGLEDEDTITKSPTTFLAYIRFLIATFLRQGFQNKIVLFNV